MLISAFNAYQSDNTACLMLIIVDKTWNRFISKRPLFRQRSVQLKFFVPAKCKTRCFRYISLMYTDVCTDVYIRIYHITTISPPVFSNLTANRIYKLHCDANSHTNQNANLCPHPILPTAMPTTAHIWFYMVWNHVISNMGSGWHCSW